MNRLLNFAFKFNLRRYNRLTSVPLELGMAVQVDGFKTRVELVSAYAVGNQRLKLDYDGSLSNFAFKFNLRR